MFKAGTTIGKKPFSRPLGIKIAQELGHLIGMEPDICWLFCSPDTGIEELLKGVYEVFPHTKLVGCTTDGEISDHGIIADSVVLGGISTDEIKFHVTSTKHLRKDSFAAGQRLALEFPSGTRYVHLFSDGITGNGSAILEGMKSVFSEDLIVVGGTAGDGGCFRRTWQFIGNRVLTDSAVAVALEGDFGMGTGVRSGWMPIGLPKTVTRSDGNILYELNGEPALEVYERFLGKHAKKLPSIGVEYPLGLVGEESKVSEREYFLLRATMSVDREKKAIFFAGDIPEGSKVNLTCGDVSSVLDAASAAAKDAVLKVSNRKPLMLFCYSCTARKIVLGRRTKEEIENVLKIVGHGLPLIGFYTYGEYCPISRSNISYFHNETIALSLLAK